MWGYLCVLGGMGYAGGPIARLGGWGDGGCPQPNFTYAPLPRILYSMQSNSAVQMKGDCMYTVTVQWGDLVKTHKAWTLSSAKQWLYAYPNKDVFAKVTNVFGQTVAVRYKR
jgi:hypothetical protein